MVVSDLYAALNNNLAIDANMLAALFKFSPLTHPLNSAHCSGVKIAVLAAQRLALHRLKVIGHSGSLRPRLPARCEAHNTGKLT